MDFSDVLAMHRLQGGGSLKIAQVALLISTIREEEYQCEHKLSRGGGASANAFETSAPNTFRDRKAAVAQKIRLPF